MAVARRDVARFAVTMALVLGAGACGDPAPLATTGAPATRLAATFDLQAHRGGAAMTTENTLEAFARALDLGVSTLELDAEVTKDRVVVIAHDTRINTDACRDAPQSGRDDLYPFVGKPFSILTAAQVRTVDCAVEQAKDFEHQTVAADGHIPRLAE